MRRVKLLRAYKHDNPYIVGDKDVELRLADYIAGPLVQGGDAVYLDADPVAGPTRAELEAEEAAIQLKESDKDVADAKREEGDEEEIKRPYGNAPKSAWIRYACSVDDKMTQERGDGMTKADLMAKFGERL